MKKGKTVFWSILSVIFILILVRGMTGSWNRGRWIKSYNRNKSYNWNNSEKDFDESIENWGTEFGRSMEKWGTEFGEKMERFGENLEKELDDIDFDDDDWDYSDSSNANGKVHFEYDNISEISKVNIALVAETLNIQSTNGDKITLDIEYSGSKKDFVKVSQRGNTLKIVRHKENGIKFNTGSNSATVTLKIPKDKRTENIVYSIHNVSGRITMKDITCQSLDTENVSGRIVIEDCYSKNNIKADCVSGRICLDLTELNSNIYAENVSGRIEITVPDNSDFEADYETISGSIDTDFTRNGNRKNGIIYNGNRSNRIQVNTVSGSIKIYKK